MQRQLRANKKKTLAKGKAKKPEDPEDPEEDDLGSTKGPKRATKPKDDKNLKKGKGKPGDSAATKKAAANAKKKPAKQDEDVEEEGERQLGSPTCRFGRLGCKKCRNPNYRPRGPRKSRPAES